MNDRGLVVTCVDLHGHDTRNICCSVVSLIIQTRTRAQIEIEAVPLALALALALLRRRLISQ